MGYKVLGFVVWQGAKLYIRRRVDGTQAKVALAGVSAAAVASALAAARHQATSNS
jgi:hypothetical protein